MSHFGRVSLSASLHSVARYTALSALLASACSKPSPNAESPELAEALGPSDASAAPVIVESTASAPEGQPASAGSGPADGRIVQSLFVREQPAPCEAEGSQQCLMVRSSENEDWRLFYAPIVGFEYEPSYTYELRVAVSPVANAPADAPSLRYELVELVSRKKVGR